MKGFALIEVLVALLLFSLGILGIAGMQIVSLRHSQEAYWHSVASMQLLSFFECLRANRTPSIREHEKIDWNMDNARLLPQGNGYYQCNTGSCTVYLEWKTHQTQLLSLSGSL
jgi:type IV pilus modification protein PilV